VSLIQTALGFLLALASTILMLFAGAYVDSQNGLQIFLIAYALMPAGLLLILKEFEKIGAAESASSRS
jgi:hypothetical protein